MKKIIYIILSIFIVCFLGYTVFYVITNKTEPVPSVVATTTPPVPSKQATSTKDTVLTAKSGKTITVSETNPAGESLSTLHITSKGFENNREITLQKNKLTNIFLTDMNNDGFDELIIITTAQGSGSYGEADIFTSFGDKELKKIETPSILESDMKKGALFEGYMGHDSFVIATGTLIRTFPIYSASSTNSTPTGKETTIYYSLTGEKGVFSISLSTASKTIPQTPTSTSTPKVSTTTPMLNSKVSPQTQSTTTKKTTGTQPVTLLMPPAPAPGV